MHVLNTNIKPFESHKITALSQVQITLKAREFLIQITLSFRLIHSLQADCFSLLPPSPLSPGTPPPLVTMTNHTRSDTSNTRQAKRARLPQFREACPRRTPAQQNAATNTSSVLSVQRSSAGKLTTQERKRRRQASNNEPSPYEEPLPAEDLSPPLDLASASSSVSTEVPQKLKRKRVNTTKVSSFHFIQV